MRKKAWHQESTGKPVEEDMQTVLGDLTTTTNVTNSESPLAKIALAAGLIAAGAGLPITAWILKDVFKQPEPTPVVIEKPDFTDTDTDTSIQLSLPDWEEICSRKTIN